jgi:hypothetical protein
MKKHPDSFAFHQLLTDFRIELGELFNETAREMEAQGFTPQRVKCRLLAAIISDAFETAIFGGATPEQAAEFFSDVINERIRSHR